MFESPRIPIRFLLALALAASSCAFARGPVIGDISSEINATRFDQVPLAVGDVIEVRFAHHADWDQEVTIQPNGQASFKAIVSEVPVAGFTSEQLVERLEDSYKPLLDNPILNVVVRERSARSITIMGEVNSPGEIEIGADRRLTLVEAIGQAGSFNIRSAHLGSTLLVRWDPIQQKQVSWRINARPQHWNAEVPILLQPFDVIYIPNTPVYGVGIWVDNFIRRMIPLPFFQIS
ncbi:MAG: protein involved in polysaccharide export with SLBB domain [Planctomycetota bacterium]|jgi:protein involved in polysaccharide export with SLBB domain